MPFMQISLDAQNSPIRWVLLLPFCKKLRLREVPYLPQSSVISAARIHPSSLTSSPLTLLTTTKEQETDWILGGVRQDDGYQDDS